MPFLNSMLDVADPDVGQELGGTLVPLHMDVDMLHEVSS